MKKPVVSVDSIINTVSKMINKSGKENQLHLSALGIATNIHLARKAASNQQKRV